MAPSEARAASSGGERRLRGSLRRRPFQRRRSRAPSGVAGGHLGGGLGELGEAGLGRRVATAGGLLRGGWLCELRASCWAAAGLVAARRSASRASAARAALSAWRAASASFWLSLGASSLASSAAAGACLLASARAARLSARAASDRSPSAPAAVVALRAGRWRARPRGLGARLGRGVLVARDCLRGLEDLGELVVVHRRGGLGGVRGGDAAIADPMAGGAEQEDERHRGDYSAPRGSSRRRKGGTALASRLGSSASARRSTTGASGASRSVPASIAAALASRLLVAWAWSTACAVRSGSPAAPTLPDAGDGQRDCRAAAARGADRRAAELRCGQRRGDAGDHPRRTERDELDASPTVRGATPADEGRGDCHAHPG